MFKKIFLTFLGGIGAGSLYLHKEKVDITNENLKNILETLHNQNPKLSTFLLANMIKLKMIKKSVYFQNYIFSYGFDQDGSYIDALAQLGFNSVEIGPVSLMPSSAEEKITHCGSKIAVANINTYLQNQSQNNKHSQIGVCISSNYQIAKYTPYLIAENLIESLKQFQVLNQIFNKPAIRHYVLKLNNPEISSLDTPQYLNLIRQLIIQSHKVVNQTVKLKQDQQNKQMKNKASLIYLEIPSAKQNSNLYNMVKVLPQTTHLIIDDIQFQVIKNLKNKKDPQIILGRKRLSFNSLINRIIQGTLGQM